MSTPHAKLTVNLTPRSMAAMEMGAVLAGDNRTDTVNRALQVYAFLMEQMMFEGHRLVLVRRDGTTQDVVFGYEGPTREGNR